MKYLKENDRAKVIIKDGFTQFKKEYIGTIWVHDKDKVIFDTPNGSHKFGSKIIKEVIKLS